MDSEARQLQVRKKLLEEYVQHVLAIKMDHQAQLDKGDHPQQRSRYSLSMYISLISILILCKNDSQ